MSDDQSCHLYLAKSKIKFAGKGVFTKIDLKKDQVVEIAPVIKVPLHTIKETTLNNYVFQHPYDRKSSLVAFGFGSMYNHQDQANLHYYFDVYEKALVFEAIRDIAADEELFIHYGDNWWNTRQTKKKC